MSRVAHTSLLFAMCAMNAGLRLTGPHTWHNTPCMRHPRPFSGQDRKFPPRLVRGNPESCKLDRVLHSVAVALMLWGGLGVHNGNSPQIRRMLLGELRLRARVGALATKGPGESAGAAARV